MDKEKCMKILKKIAAYEHIYYGTKPKWDNPEFKEWKEITQDKLFENIYFGTKLKWGDSGLEIIRKEIRQLKLDDIKINVTPVNEIEELCYCVVTDPQYGFETLYIIPHDFAAKHMEILRKIYAKYHSNYDFYNDTGITVENLNTLIINSIELPIVSIKRSDDIYTNNINGWFTDDYKEDLIKIVDDYEEENKEAEKLTLTRRQ